MKITVKNDGKGKAQSFEAELHEYSDNNYWGSFEVHLTGYGVNEFSAKENLKQKLEEFLEKYNQIEKRN